MNTRQIYGMTIIKTIINGFKPLPNGLGARPINIGKNEANPQIARLMTIKNTIFTKITPLSSRVDSLKSVIVYSFRLISTAHSCKQLLEIFSVKVLSWYYIIPLKIWGSYEKQDYSNSGMSEKERLDPSGKNIENSPVKTRPSG